MLIAYGKAGNRISAEEAEKQKTYYCPMCGKQVILRRGETNISHFAHMANECEDNWHYDMSEWHCSMQNRFDEEQREIIVKHNGVVHRADILSKNKIIEFQHSPITKEELQERNNFYKSAGYKVAWVFDLQEQYESGAIQDVERDDSALLYKWSYPKRFLQCFPMPRENNKDLLIFFYWIDAEGYECFNRVIWSAGEDGRPDFKRFIVSEYCLGFECDTCEKMEIEAFFETKADLLNKRLMEINCRYNIKQSGVKGYPQKDYICPRTGNFGLKRYGESACVYCKYCAAIKEYSKGFSSYCCYPIQVNEVLDGYFEYECSGIPVY